MMRPFFLLASLMLALPAYAQDHDGHDGHSGHAGHDHSHMTNTKAFGEPGDPAKATRTIAVTAVDANEAMGFEFAPFTIKQGETIKFVVTNKGSKIHEFSIGDTASQRAHAAMMKKMPHMNHEGDPSAVTLKPGETKELTWLFSKMVPGQIEFACHLKGHYEAGMSAKVKMVQ